MASGCYQRYASKLYLWMLLMFNLQVWSESNNGFVQTLPSVNLLNGTQGILQCAVTNRTSYVAWWKTSPPSGRMILAHRDASKSTGETGGPGYDTGLFNMTSNYSLVINKVTIQDAGTYFCQVLTALTYKFYRDETNVTVYVPPKRPYPTIDRCMPSTPDQPEPAERCILKSAQSSSSVNLTCSVDLYYPSFDLHFSHSSQRLEVVASYDWQNTDGTRGKSITILVNASSEPYECVALGVGVSGEESEKVASIYFLLIPEKGDSKWLIMVTIIPSVLILMILMVSMVLFCRYLRQRHSRTRDHNRIELQEDYELVLDKDDNELKCLLEPENADLRQTLLKMAYESGLSNDDGDTFLRHCVAAKDILTFLNDCQDLASKEVTQSLNNLRYKTCKKGAVRECLGRYMNKQGFCDILPRFYETMNDNGFFDDANENSNTSRRTINTATQREQIMTNYRHLTLCYFNLTDASTEMCKEIHRSGYLDKLFITLNAKTKGLNIPDGIVHHTLGIIYNCFSQVPELCTLSEESIHVLDELKGMQSNQIMLLIYLTYSFILKKPRTCEMKITGEVIKMLLGALEAALEAHDVRHLGIGADELTQGIHQLALEDNTRRVLSDEYSDGIRSFRKIFADVKGKYNDTLKRHAACAIWQLAFEKRVELQKTSDLLKALQSIKTSSGDKLLQHACTGALLEIEEPPSTPSGQDVDQARGHIVVSYHQSCRGIAMEIKGCLEKRGYNIWMYDANKTGGDGLDAMAKAVQKSSVILVCASFQYSTSKSCRTELNYARRLKKETIPLCVEEGYSPHGWFDMWEGKAVFHMYSQHMIEVHLQSLVEKLGNRAKAPDQC